jgi:hypothetical protein
MQRRRNAFLHIDHVRMAQGVKLSGGYTWLHKGCDVIKHFRSQTACDTHFGDFIRCF